MDIESVERLWNERYGDLLPLADGLLKHTFLTWPENQRYIRTVGPNVLLFKISGRRLFLHLAITNKEFFNYPSLVKTLLTQEMEKNNCHQIEFGGEKEHVFPGVPLILRFSKWLKVFDKKGEEVCDLESSNYDVSNATGTLRLPNNKEEELELLSLIQEQFGGRWAQEVTRDFSENKSSPYFGYYQEGKLVGYQRMYGWQKDYWGPGVYFAGPSNGVGGIGPVGIKKEFRGNGYGTQMLRKGLEVMETKGIGTVRIDWTTEVNFYEKSGFNVVQRYQPAIFRL